jgi:hypothetical protein
VANNLDNHFSGEKPTLTIRVNVDGPLSDRDLHLRYILAETLEERCIGEVCDEGVGEGYMEVTLVISSEENDDEVRSILKSLGLLTCSELIYNKSTT